MKRFFPVIHIQNEEQSLKNAILAQKAAANGIFLIHHGGDNELLLEVAEFIHKKLPDLWIGINALGMKMADVFNSPSWVNGFWNDNAGINMARGEISISVAQNIQESRKNSGHKAEYFGGFAFKYQPLIPINKLEEATTRASEFLDVVTTSGNGTGVAADLEKVKLIKKGLLKGKRLGIASGITPENIKEYLPYVDDFLVASGISLDEYNIDKQKLINLINKL